MGIRPRKTVKPEKESAKVNQRIGRLVPAKIREGKRTGVREAAQGTKVKWDRRNQQRIIGEASNHPKKESPQKSENPNHLTNLSQIKSQGVKNPKHRLLLHPHCKRGTKNLNVKEIVMISNRCTRKKENVLIANMRTVRGHQNLRKMEMLIANQEAVAVLPRRRHHHHPGIIMILRESVTCHQSFVKQIICMKNKKSIEESYLTSV